MNEQNEIDDIIIDNMKMCAEYQMKVIAARLILRGCKEHLEKKVIGNAVKSEAGKLQRFVKAMYTKDETISQKCFDVLYDFINNLKNDTIKIVINSLNSELGGVYDEFI